jgi:hypothetical protein
MTSPSPLERLAGPGNVLAKEAPDEKEFDGLVRSGLARLKDAENEANSLDSRFDLAYSAAHALCLAALMERLAELVNEWPHEAVRVAHLMVEFDVGWGPSGWEGELEQILKVALTGGHPEARKEALSLIDLLGRKGFLSFRELRK